MHGHTLNSNVSCCIWHPHPSFRVSLLAEFLVLSYVQDSSLLLLLTLRALDSLDINEVVVLGALPQGLDALQSSSMKSETRPRQQLKKRAGDRYKHQQVKATLTQWHGGCGG